ncbi:MAG TPA: DUF2934 domain-containing protein [Acidobacteriaceae bacterium]|jgi:hypothetical protein|nr:DUF2934 domain-containing protein [Acidobacteriaceae bacterium]
MAEKVKKEKAPAKPRTSVSTAKKTTAKKTNGNAAIVKTASREEIASLAYQYWKARGGQSGQDWQDWLRAERELTSA